MDQITVTRKELYVLFFSLLLVPLMFFGSGVFVGNVISTPSVKDSSTISETPVLAAIQDEAEVPAETSSSLLSGSDIEQPEPVDIVTIDEAVTSGESVTEAVAMESSSQETLTGPTTLNVAQSAPVAATDMAKRETIAPVEQFAAQVGLFSDEDRAKQWKTTLDPRFDYAVVPKSGSEHTRYSVIIGPYLSKAEARVMVDRYKLVTNSDAFVVILHGEAGQMVAGL